MKRISQLNSTIVASALSALNYPSANDNPVLSFSNFCKTGFGLSSIITKKTLNDDLKILYDAVIKNKKGRLMIVNNNSVFTIITNDFVVSKSLRNSLRKSNILFHDVELDGIESIKDIIHPMSDIVLIQ